MIRIIQLIEKSQSIRKAIMMAIDILSIGYSFFLIDWIKGVEVLKINSVDALFVYLFFLSVSLLIYHSTGQYQSRNSYLSSYSLYQISLRSLLVLIALLPVSNTIISTKVDLNLFIVFWLIITLLTSSTRLLLRDFLILMRTYRKPNIARVAIYGAGEAGFLLSQSLISGGGYNIKFFIDDNINLSNRSINGIPIIASHKIERFISQIDQVLLAIPSLKRGRRIEIVKRIGSHSIPCLQVPSIEEITSGKTKISDLRPISIEDLLGRNKVEPNYQLLGGPIKGKSICVTGAGGSIGAELCRQLIRLKPKSLVLIERNEAALYTIDQEIKSKISKDIKLHTILGSALDKKLLINTFSELNVNVIFHAAAYKHVPLVEKNPLEGIKNNIYSTKAICMAAEIVGVDHVILISTDKAVRPTNIMGASKRAAEMVVQAHAEEMRLSKNSSKEIITCYSMVRFGNVLNSSGSVIPLFQNQIKNGGPITITHPEVTRYFMTITEASQLVIQTCSLAKGGDVFLLDMGEPIKIYDMALQMIRISGLTLKSKNNPDGDIEIEFTGLRPGEKLYEELLIENNPQSTSHPLIFRANERFMRAQELYPKLEELEKEIETKETKKALNLLKEIIN